MIVAPDAEADLRIAYEYIRDRNPHAAKEWIRALRSSMRKLSRFPERCPLAAESALSGMPIRQMLFGSGNRGTYRILFAISGNAVKVAHVRYGSMLPLGVEQDE